MEAQETGFEIDEQVEFDYYLQFEWPEHIEAALRRLLWVALVEEAESDAKPRHTSLLRGMIGTHPDTPTVVLEFLCDLVDIPLLERIAEHPKASSRMLSRLSEHPQWEIRMAVANNTNADIGILMNLSDDPHVDVRYCMAENPALASRMLQKLTQDENPYVATRAAKTLSMRNRATVQKFPTRDSLERKLG